MTKTFCDICGVELTPETTAQFHNEFGVNHTPNVLYCANVHDLCKRCAEAGAEINVVATMRKFWQERVSELKVKDAISHCKEVKAAHDQS